MAGQIVLLSGERGAGKSTACQRLASLARTRGYTCAGIITLCRETGARDVLDLRTGIVRRLTVEPPSEPAVVQGRFRFSADTLNWAAHVVEQALPCDLLIVDELGPLEIERGQGWHQALDVLATRGYALAVVVVRPELVERVLARFPTWATITVSVTFENRDHLPATLFGTLANLAHTETATRSLRKPR